MLVPPRSGGVLLSIFSYGSELLELVSARARPEASSANARAIRIPRGSAEAALGSRDLADFLARRVGAGARLRPASDHVGARVPATSCVHLALTNGASALVGARSRIHVAREATSEPGAEADLRLALVEVGITRIVSSGARTLLCGWRRLAPSTCATKAKLWRCRMLTPYRVWKVVSTWCRRGGGAQQRRGAARPECPRLPFVIS